MMRCAKRAGIRTNIPYADLSAKEKHWLIEGADNWNGNWEQSWYGIRRFFAFLETKAYKMHVRVMLSRYRSYTECPVCKGARLKSEGLFWRVGTLDAADEALADTSGRGRYRRFCPAGMGAQARSRIDTTPGLTIHDLMELPVKRLLPFFRTLRTQSKDEACTLVIDEILTRLSYLMDVGLGYLTLGRQSRTLSGGEVQRVNLTTALGTRLVDTLFVLDEPSVGLHPRDMDRVNAILARLKNAGNTLVVVEHDPQVMLCGDRLIEMGPGAGEAGGTVVFDGTPRAVKTAESLTGSYLSGRRSADGRARHVPPEDFDGEIRLEGACAHNLQNVDVAFPLGAMTAVTGVSGSGKSSLIGDVLVPALERFFGRSAVDPACRSVTGAINIDDVRFVDQSPIGKSSRSNPVV
ncbi:MAG: excinuclease ABC subunit A, partial [Duodenibacillus sp.]